MFKYLRNLDLSGFKTEELDPIGFDWAPTFIYSEDSKYKVNFSWSLHGDWIESFENKTFERFKTLIFNKVQFDKSEFDNFADFKDSVDFIFTRMSHTDKINSMLDYLNDLSIHSGSEIHVSLPDITKTQIYRKFYFDSWEEMFKYVGFAIDLGYLKKEYPSGEGFYITFTFKGLTYLDSFRDSINSNSCFIAKCFDDDLDYIHLEGIIPALEATRFKPLILKGAHVDTKQTINDAIIAGIKKAKFTIADFTEHRNGVYFEAGYALGRGQKVIYCCKDDQLKGAHFDTKPYQHIVWKDAKDLKRQLIDKIEAIIME